MTCVRFSPKGDLLASTGDKVIILRNLLKEDEPEKHLEGHSSNIWCLNFSHKGKFIVAGASDKSFSIWDVSCGMLVIYIIFSILKIFI